MKQRVVVTGADGALGSAVVDELSKNFDVIQADINTVDLRDFEATKKWAQEVGGPIFGLIALAGGFGMADIDQMDADHCNRMFDLNSRTAFSSLSAFGGLLSEGAAVVMVASQAYEGAKGMSAYAASKAAVVSLAKSAAEEWKPRGIRVNVILPDIIDTPANRESMPNADFDKWQKPEEISRVISFLISADAANISGNAIKLGRV
jgi:NAD(P)-dependent dehydrogenase (short-subunit alcohol dehydrogenase family)